MQDHEKIRWFHSIEVGNGVVTSGIKSAEEIDGQFNVLKLNADNLRNRRLLDIGCADGYFSLRCARLGADVTAIDGTYSDAIRYVRRHAEPKFKFYCMDFLSPSFLELGRYDVILYFGVLYHTMYPFEHLKRLAAASNKGTTLLFETAIYNIPGHEQEATIFYDFGAKFSSSGTSPIFPSIAWIKEIVKRVGFVDIVTLNQTAFSNNEHRGRGRVVLRATYAGVEDTSPFLYASEQVTL